MKSLSKATREKSAEEMASDVRELLGGQSPDVTIECSGVEASVRYMVNHDTDLISSLKVWDHGNQVWRLPGACGPGQTRNHDAHRQCCCS